MNIDPNAPAFPTSDTIYPNGEVQYGFNGLTIRADIAARLLMGMLANPENGGLGSTDPRSVAINAINMADHLIAQLNQP